jgi:hypothetical protein
MAVPEKVPDEPRREAAREPAGPPPKPKERSLLSLVTKISGAATAISAVLGVVFILWPQLKPEPPPPVKSAQLAKLTVDRKVTFGQYLDRFDLPKDAFSANQLARQGVFLQFRIETTGFKGKELPLKWELFDAKSGNQVGESKSTFVEPGANTDSLSWHAWVPLPGRKGPFFVLVQLLNEKGIIPLDRLQTRPFPGLAAR